MIHPEDDIPFGADGSPDADEVATEELVGRVALAICGALDMAPFDQLHSCRQESLRLAAQKAVTTIMHDEDAITRVAQVHMDWFRAAMGVEPKPLPTCDPEIQREWLDETRTAFAAIAPNLPAPTPGTTRGEA